MNSNDSDLRSLFEQAKSDLDANAFTVQTLERIEKKVKISRWTWIGVGAVVVLLEVFLLDFAATFNKTLAVPLIETGDGNIARLLQPINSVAGLLAILLLTTHHFMRRFRT